MTTNQDTNLEVGKKLIRKSLRFSLIMLLISLAIGMAGYHYLSDMSWDDSFLNASMILTGMWPVHDPQDTTGKIFAGLYALYSGIVFLSIVALMIVPVFHTYLQ